MMIDCSIVVLFLQDLSYKRKKIRVLSLFLVQSGYYIFAKALCDLGASINLMPLSIYKMLGLGDSKPTAMRLLMVDQTVKSPIGILHDMLLKVESFIFLADFFILDCEIDFEVPIILRRTFLAKGRVLVDMENGQMKFWLNNEEATFNICRSMR